MLNDFLAVSTLVSIWFSLLASLVTLYGATCFWLKHSKKVISITPLKRYPTITIVVPAHNEEVVIANTTKGILNLNYPASKIELLLYADIVKIKLQLKCVRRQIYLNIDTEMYK